MKSTIILVLALIFAVFYMNANQLSVEHIEYLIGTHKFLAPFLFSVIYILTLLTGFPTSTIFFLSAGFLFGVIKGAILVLITSVIGSILCFIIGRFLFCDWIKNNFSRKVNIFLNGVQHDGWKFVALTRLVLVIPFGLSSYLLGITNISLPSFAITTFFAEIPAAFCYSYIGSLGREAVKGGSENFIIKFLIGLGLVSFLFAIPLVIKHIKLAKNSDLDGL